MDKGALARATRHRAPLCCCVLLTVLAAQLGADHRESPTGDDGSAFIQRVVGHANTRGVAVRAVRELRAGTVTGKHLGWMQVETTLDQNRGLQWTTIECGGSERTRDKVFLALLKNEADAWRSGSGDASALTPENYVFTLSATLPDGLRQLRVVPRRSDPRLIDGTLLVSADGHPVRLEGRLAKSPSFWVKSVTVVTHYTRFEGVSLPASVESLADIRMVGQATFTMRYRYSEVAGRNVTHAVASEPFVGPSAEILALHQASTER